MIRTSHRRFTTVPLAALALALAALGAPALAAHRPDGPPGRGAHFGSGGPRFDPETIEERLDLHAERIAELLDLTDEQRAAFDELRADALDAARPKMDRMRAAHDEMRELLDSGSSDAAAIGDRMIEVHRLRGELKATRESVESGLVKLLTPEQKIAFETLKKARHDFEERGHERFGHGPGHGGRFERGPGAPG